MDEKTEGVIDRRDFLKGTMLIGAGVMGTGALAACSPNSSSTSGDNASSDTTTSNTAVNSNLAATPWGDYYPWPANPPEISDTDVEEEIDCDVAVVGLGVSGVAAFRAAAEAGAKVVGVEKGSTPQCRSSQYCYLNGKLTEHFGLPELDLEAIIKEEFEECMSITNYSIIRKFILNDADAMDWWIEGGDCYIPGKEEIIDPMSPDPNHPVAVTAMSDPGVDWENERQAAFPECLNFTDHQAILDNNLAKGEAKGAVAYFGHFGEKLIVGSDGRVTGIYARNADNGKYKKINVTKGVCMASGCCRSNEDMVRYFAPNIIWNGNGNPWPNLDVEGNKTNTGDGYKMGYWAGASLQQYQCSQVHVMGGPGDNDDQGESMGFTGPLLRINYNGKRFMNEDTCAADAEYPIELQPKHKCFMLCDSHFEEQVAQCVNTFPAALADWDARVGDGTIFKGETLKELFDSIEGMNTEAALETVEHYNEICANGVDTDFTKKAKYLWPVQDGPFYAQRMGVGLCLVMMGGLESDEEAHVLNLEREVIPGLYASGNIQGNRFAIKYPFRLSGHSHAMAMFYGKVAGENAARDV